MGENIAIVFKPGIAADRVVVMKLDTTIIPVIIAADDLDGKTKLVAMFEFLLNFS